MLSYTGPINRLRFVKLMFLLSRNHPSYDFVPYKFGPFSFELYHDLDVLSREGHISFDGEKVESLEPQRMVGPPWSFIEEFFKYPDNKLISHIYNKYPFYTVKSEISKHMIITNDGSGIYTIGYEGRSIDLFVSSLVKNAIGILIDVRNNPFSRKYGFSKTGLSNICQKMGIDYIHIPELGISSEVRNKTGPDDWVGMLDGYERSLENKECHINRITDLGKDSKVALMCFEKDRSLCHRSRLASYLSKRGFVCEDL